MMVSVTMRDAFPFSSPNPTPQRGGDGASLHQCREEKERLGGLLGGMRFGRLSFSRPGTLTLNGLSRGLVTTELSQASRR